jgi:hypothetical protein
MTQLLLFQPPRIVSGLDQVPDVYALVSSEPFAPAQTIVGMPLASKMGMGADDWALETWVGAVKPASEPKLDQTRPVSVHTNRIELSVARAMRKSPASAFESWLSRSGVDQPLLVPRAAYSN